MKNKRLPRRITLGLQEDGVIPPTIKRGENWTIVNTFSNSSVPPRVLIHVDDFLYVIILKSEVLTIIQAKNLSFPGTTRAWMRPGCTTSPSMSLKLPLEIGSKRNATQRKNSAFGYFICVPCSALNKILISSNLEHGWLCVSFREATNISFWYVQYTTTRRVVHVGTLEQIWN